MSETKTAKVTEILQRRKWEGPHGTVYYYKLEMDNGEIGEIGKKKDNAIHVGESLTYTSEDGDWGLKFKAVQENSNGFGGKGAYGSRGSSASFSLSYSKDLMIAAMPLHPEIPVSQWVDVTITTATKFQNWLKANES